MKKIYFLALLTVLTCHSQQLQQTLKVVGKNLTTVSGQTIVLRGINYPIIDDGSISLTNAAEYQHKIDEAAKTGANAIRIPWYTDGTHWRDIPGPPTNGTPGTVMGYVNNGHLSNLIGYCHTKGMIPILEIHNLTCSGDWIEFNNTVMPWWKSQVILNLIEAHKGYLVINLANEFGQARWTGNTTNGMNVFKTNYNAAVSQLRALNVNVPIMIDAPDCAQSSTELLSAAESMVTSDPQHNLIFSSHAYWSGYAQTQAAVQIKLNEAQNTNVCFVLGEVASTQDNNSCGDFSLASLYPTILTEACSRNIGWLGWTYTLDCSSPREMTTNGEFNTLTVYGNDLVNNSVYGLKSSGGCGASLLASSEFEDGSSFSVYPNPATNRISIRGSETIENAKIFDISGRLLKNINSDFETVDVAFLKTGTYIIQIQIRGNRMLSQKLLKS